MNALRTRQPRPVSGGLPLLRDLVHERTACSTTTAGSIRSPIGWRRWSSSAGFDSFLDYYYLLKYDEQAPRANGTASMDALSVPETYFWREIDQVRAIVDASCRRWCAAHRRTAGAHLERAVRDRRGAADDRDGARGGAAGSTRGAIEIHAQRRQPPRPSTKARAGRYRERSFRSLPPRLRESISRATATPGWSAPALHAARHVVERRQPRRAEGASAPRAAPDHLLPQRVHLFFARGRRSGRRARSPRPCRRPATCASARPNRCCS